MKNLDSDRNYINLNFHIHSCLSPCGSLYMTPRIVVKELIKCKIEIISITDHNCYLNYKAFYNYLKNYGILVFPGMEIQSEEEVHIIVVFPDITTADKWQKIIEKNINYIKNDPDKYGDQPVIDENENILFFYDNFLLQSVNLSFDSIVKLLSEEELIFFPAHIDAESYSVYSQLEFLPLIKRDGKSVIKLVEVLNPAAKVLNDIFLLYKKSITSNINNIVNSDAHYPEDICKRYFQINDSKIIDLITQWKKLIKKVKNFKKDNLNKIEILNIEKKIYKQVKDNLFKKGSIKLIF